jgi:putative nucleotidyltransferase with HDIG domain
MEVSALSAELVRGIRELEPLPRTARELLALVRGEDASITRVAELIEYDQAITANFLRLARSAAFAGTKPPATVLEAVRRLGTMPLLTLVLRDYMSRMRHGAPCYDLSEEDLWGHSAASQLAVEALFIERPGLPPEAATAALLHDIGKLVISRCCHVPAAEIAERATARGVPFIVAERELLGVDHTTVGAEVARAWSFPDATQHAIRHHHDAPIAQPWPVLDAVVVANLVAKTIGAGLGAEGFYFVADESALGRLGVDYQMFARTCLRTHDLLRELRASSSTGIKVA